MKALKDFLIEELATPGDTTGAGNPMAPTGDSPGSEPLDPSLTFQKTAKCRRHKRKKDII